MCYALVHISDTQKSRSQLKGRFANMILSCYIFDLRRHLHVLNFIPGFAPYEFQKNTNVITISRSRFRRRMYTASQLGNLASFLAMSYFFYATKYDIFLTLFGLLVQVAYFTTLLIRWNLSCSSKFIDVFNQFLVFEPKQKLKLNKNFHKQPGRVKEKKYVLFNAILYTLMLTHLLNLWAWLCFQATLL